MDNLEDQSASQASSPGQPLLTTLIRKRGVLKRKVTSAFNRVDYDNSNNVEVTCNAIASFLEQIKIVDNEICNEFASADSADRTVDDEMENQTQYTITKATELASLKQSISRAAVTPPQPRQSTDPNINFDLKLPTLNCRNFTGESSNVNEYYS